MRIKGLPPGYPEHTSYTAYKTSYFFSVYGLPEICIIILISRAEKQTQMRTAKGVLMKVRIEIDPALLEDEIIIRCRQVEDHILKLQKMAAEMGPADSCMTLQNGETKYYVPLDQLLFFESEGRLVQAHTAAKLYMTERKLYELEESLPGCFMRISKSTIVNLDHIYSITRNLAASSVVEFYGTAKKVYVSRNYYKALMERLGEKRKRI